MPQEDKFLVNIYTDGACSGNPGKGGYGAILVYVDANGHAWGDWYETKAPTDTEAGEERRDCGNCDCYETNVLPALMKSGTWGSLTWTLNTTTGLRTDFINLKSASIPARAIKSINPREPRELMITLKLSVVCAAVCISCPGVPRKLSQRDKIPTRSIPIPVGPTSIPTIKSEITVGI